MFEFDLEFLQHSWKTLKRQLCVNLLQNNWNSTEDSFIKKNQGTADELIYY